jgi:hypothetical protein
MMLMRKYGRCIVFICSLYTVPSIMSHRPSLLQRILDESSSDDDDDISFGEYNIFHHPSHIHQKRVGSMPGHIVKYRDRQGGHARMFQDYLADNSTFNLSDFRRRFV